MASIVAVFNMKGGVGKSTIAVNLAACAAKVPGAKVLLWDIDAQGAATCLLGEDDQGRGARRLFSRDVDLPDMIGPTRWPGLDLLGADMTLRDLDHVLASGDKPKLLRKLLKSIRERYDTIVLDLPPALGELSEQVFRAADVLVVPVVPNPLSERSLRQVERSILAHDGRRPAVLPVISMADRRRTMHRDFIEAHSEWPVIPLLAQIEKSAQTRCPVTISAPRSAPANAFADLWRGIEHSLGVPVRPALPPARATKAKRGAAGH